MLGFPYALLIALLASFAIPSSANDLECVNLFADIRQQEPYLDEELKDLQALCEQDVKRNKVAYWRCVNSRMQQGAMSFERFILSDQVCHDQGSVAATP